MPPFLTFRPSCGLSLLQFAGVDSEPCAANRQRRGEHGDEGAAGGGHLQHHAGDEVSGQHSRPHSAPRLPDAAGQHPAAPAAGPAEPGFPAGNTHTHTALTRCFAVHIACSAAELYFQTFDKSVYI